MCVYYFFVKGEVMLAVEYRCSALGRVVKVLATLLEQVLILT
jgi:hypothetical protein